jgi:hypothetical protein
VRIAGVVVAVDEYDGRHVYTIDDGSGSTIECAVNIPRPPLPQSGGQSISLANHIVHEQPQQKQVAHRPDPYKARQPFIDKEVDVGHVLEVKGGLKRFRDGEPIQITVEKMVHLSTTAEEVRFWTRLEEFWQTVIGRPWVLSSREVRRCRREAEGLRPPYQRHRRVPLGQLKAPGQSNSNSQDRTGHIDDKLGASKPTRKTGVKVGVKKWPTEHGKGKYDALGL